MLFTKRITKCDDLMHIKSYAPDRPDHWMSGRHPASDSSDHFTTRVDLAAFSDASSGHLRRCSDADTTNKCLSRGKDASILSWPTIMGYLKQLIVCNLASGHYTSFPTNELTSSRAVFVQPLGACCYRNK
eukprot:scaffold2364_cov79-Skeletonema_dohrnii-CCMP3373.AAC.1